MSVRKLCHISFFVAIICVCAQIQIPMPHGVPLTLQTFAVMLTGIILGVKNGIIASFVYIALGALGAPVFSAFSGGLGVLFGRTGGFILSFPLLALAAAIGAGFEKTKHNRLWLAVFLIVGAIINFSFGVLIFSFVTSVPVWAAFGFSAAPFIPTELIKIALLVVFGKTIKQALIKVQIPLP